MEPQLLNRFLFRISHHYRYGAFDIAAFGIRADADFQCGQVLAALKLIAQLSPREFARMARDCPRVLVGTAGPAAAIFESRSGLVVLDFDTIRNHGHEPITLALLLVHESKHARIHRRGIDYPSHRDRIERICRQAERAFADRLAEIDRIRYLAYYDELDANPPDYSDEAHIARTVGALRQLGVRKWMTGPLEAYARWRLRRRSRTSGKALRAKLPSNDH